MWHPLLMFQRADPALADSARELLRATARSLIVTTIGVCGALLLVVWIKPPSDVDVRIIPLMVAAILACLVALAMLPHRLMAAAAIWQAALGALLLLAVHLFREPLIASLLALFPLIAAVTLSWPGALIAEAAIMALAWGLTLPVLAPPLPAPYAVGIAAAGAVAGLLGWATTRTLHTVTQWSLYSFEQARQRLDEALNQRLEFQQTQEDLLQANRELARLSDRLKAMYQVAEEARHAKEEFVANVSHELRTPLNMIIGFSEMITQAPEVYGEGLPPALLADIAAIQRNSQHLARLVDDVLDLSQVEAGKTVLTKEWVSLAEVVDAALLAVRALFDSKGLYLRAAIPADLPPVFCDSTRIRQVILNLLSNAGRLTQAGGVTVRARREKGEIVVSVADTGPGIAAQDQQRLFQPFQQLDTGLNRTHGGTGLGLSISKRFVEMHEGRMWLTSPADPPNTGAGGPGATFSFSLPAQTPDERLPARGAAPLRWITPYQTFEERIRPSKAPAPTPAPRFVLLGHGDALVRRFREHLGAAEVVAVGDLAAARRELSRSPARALIVNAPPFAGEPITADQLADLPYETPAMIYWMPTEDEAARRLGVVRYLVKPITRETLLAALDHLGPNVASVLLVDDEPEIVRLFSRIMASAERPYRVLRATDGRRALDLLRERRPDVMLLDLILPGMDGFQVLREKSQDPAIRDIPVVIISSRDPVGQPVVSNALTVTRGGGLSIRDLATCIQALSAALTPAQEAVRAPTASGAERSIS